MGTMGRKNNRNVGLNRTFCKVTDLQTQINCLVKYMQRIRSLSKVANCRPVIFQQKKTPWHIFFKHFEIRASGLELVRFFQKSSFNFK